MAGRWLAIALAATAVLRAADLQLARAQADEHARAIARATCQSGRHSPEVLAATAALAHDPGELGPRMRLADALVDQGCYQEAVSVLEAGADSHPRNAELAGKLRDVRSLVTEQTYIEGLTRAAETAQFQRNQLRCLKLADVDACDDALKIKPDDEQMQKARQAALSRERASDAVTANTAVAAANPTATPAAPVQEAPKPRKRTPKASPHVVDPPEPPPAVASLQPQKTFSNDAPAGRTN